MTDSQDKNGFTGIPNDPFEKLYSLPLSGSEFRVLLCVIRHTLGWHKKMDRISISRLVIETTLARTTVCETTNKLVSKCLLFKHKKYINHYQFNTDYKQWVVSNRSLGSYQTTTGLVSKGQLKTVSKKQPTKESKETITKETLLRNGGKPQSELQNLIDFSKGLGFPLQGTQQLNRFNASNLLKKFGLEKSKTLVSAAVSTRGRPFAPQINDFIQLYRKCGDLVNYYEKEKNERKSNRKIIG